MVRQKKKLKGAEDVDGGAVAAAAAGIAADVAGAPPAVAAAACRIRERAKIAAVWARIRLVIPAGIIAALGGPVVVDFVAAAVVVAVMHRVFSTGLRGILRPVRVCPCRWFCVLRFSAGMRT